MAQRCSHAYLRLMTEKDHCKWIVCVNCRKRGPKKHSAAMAFIAFGVALGDQHPRPKR